MDWLEQSVTEGTYTAVQEQIDSDKLEGTMTFRKMCTRYINKCFKKYPRFQTEQILGKKFTQNAQSRAGMWCKYRQSDTHNSEDCRDKPAKGTGKGKGHSKGSGKGRGKGYGKGGKGSSKGKGRGRGSGVGS